MKTLRVPLVSFVRKNKSLCFSSLLFSAFCHLLHPCFSYRIIIVLIPKQNVVYHFHPVLGKLWVKGVMISYIGRWNRGKKVNQNVERGCVSILQEMSLYGSSWLVLKPDRLLPSRCNLNKIGSPQCNCHLPFWQNSCRRKQSLTLFCKI
jgi:hypothetical protein